MSILRRIDLATLTSHAHRSLTRRSAVPDPGVRKTAAAICDEVRTGGDEAMRSIADRLGGGFRRVTEGDMEAALDGLARARREALQSSIDAVAAFHRTQIPVDTVFETRPGVTITRAWSSLRRVGAYVPGGKAAYPSTVVMTVVPAVVAGVEEMIVATPAGPDGVVPPATLAACRLTGVTEVWAMGGAQAVAAMAYGTDTVAPVDKIVGPGNAWVTAAKLEVFGVCAIDLPAGPSEVLVLADATADPGLVAVDLLCQAEHGPDSPAVLVTTDPALVEAVEAELARLLPAMERREILAKALADHGLALIARSPREASDFANRYASEHVTILTADPESDVARLVNAGSVYVGPWAPESAGDYATGANHVLPTGGMAAASGPLSTADFGSWRQIQRIDRPGLEGLMPTIVGLAETEGLPAHALAATIRLERTR